MYYTILILDDNAVKGKVGLFGFPKLDSLNLVGREVSSLYIGENSCKSLRVLDFSKNQIQQFTIEGELTKLEVLNLSMNKLKELPDLTKMPNLRVLNISDNQLSELPYSILKLKKLKRVSLGNNDFTLTTSRDVLKRLMDKNVKVMP